jgi:hypothetical protein
MRQRRHPHTSSSREATVHATSGGVGEQDALAEKSSESDRQDSSTTRLLLEPNRVLSRYRTKRFRLHLDNRDGRASQHVRLHGCDPERRIRFAFRPRTLDVPPGHVGSATVVARVSGPSSSTTETHMITVVADDGSTTIEATAAFVRSTGRSLRVWRGLFTLLGAMSVAVGAFRPWLDDDGPGLLLTVPRVGASLEAMIAAVRAGGLPDIAALVIDLQPLERLMIFMMASSIALGLLETGGQRTRYMALFVTVTISATAMFYLFIGAHLADGVLLVLLGGFAGLIGGICVRR